MPLFQYSDQATTEWFYLDKEELAKFAAKRMAELGFRVFPARNINTLPKYTPTNKKDPVNMQGLDYLGGAYRTKFEQNFP